MGNTSDAEFLAEEGILVLKKLLNDSGFQFQEVNQKHDKGIDGYVPYTKTRYVLSEMNHGNHEWLEEVLKRNSYEQNIIGRQIQRFAYRKKRKVPGRQRSVVVDKIPFQVKASDSFCEGQPEWKRSIKVEHIRYWKESQFPVILVYVGQNGSIRYLNTKDIDISDKLDQDTVVIGLTEKLTSDNIEEVMWEAYSHVKIDGNIANCVYFGDEEKHLLGMGAAWASVEDSRSRDILLSKYRSVDKIYIHDLVTVLMAPRFFILSKLDENLWNYIDTIDHFDSDMIDVHRLLMDTELDGLFEWLRLDIGGLNPEQYRELIKECHITEFTFRDPFVRINRYVEGEGVGGCAVADGCGFAGEDEIIRDKEHRSPSFIYIKVVDPCPEMDDQEGLDPDIAVHAKRAMDYYGTNLGLNDIIFCLLLYIDDYLSVFREIISIYKEDEKYYLNDDFFCSEHWLNIFRRSIIRIKNSFIFNAYRERMGFRSYAKDEYEEFIKWVKE